MYSFIIQWIQSTTTGIYSKHKVQVILQRCIRKGKISNTRSTMSRAYHSSWALNLSALNWSALNLSAPNLSASLGTARTLSDTGSNLLLCLDISFCRTWILQRSNHTTLKLHSMNEVKIGNWTQGECQNSSFNGIIWLRFVPETSYGI